MGARMNRASGRVSLATAAALSATLFLTAGLLGSDFERRLMSFEMEDQFGTLHSHLDYAGQPVVVNCGDRAGSKYTVAWGPGVVCGDGSHGGSDAAEIHPGGDAGRSRRSCGALRTRRH
jgi:hypothetical protein